MIKSLARQFSWIILYAFLYNYVFDFEILVIVMLAQILYYTIRIRDKVSGTTKGDR